MQLRTVSCVQNYGIRLLPVFFVNMQTHVFLAVAVCALLAGARAEGDVVDLTDATFQETITKNTFVLVEFFAPCKSQKKC